MANVTALDHLNLSVDSFEETADFYRRLFGFSVVEQGVQEGVVWGILRSGAAMLCIYEHPEYGALQRRVTHGINHFALRITDRAAWEATIEANGLQLGYGGVIEWPHSTAWYITDPTGYEIEVALWKDGSIQFA